MSKILVAYSTNSGSTVEVAEAVAAELTLAGHDTEVKSIADVNDLAAYDSVVIGAPMIIGWQNIARRFLKKNRSALASKKVACFACAMRLTRVKDEKLPAFPILFDENLVAEPVNPGSLSIKERFTTTGHYLGSMLQGSAGIKPVSTAFFKGKLEMFRLKWWQAAFVMVAVQASPGDFRDWDVIRSWGRSLSEIL